MLTLLNYLGTCVLDAGRSELSVDRLGRKLIHEKLRNGERNLYEEEDACIHMRRRMHAYMRNCVMVNGICMHVIGSEYLNPKP